MYRSVRGAVTFIKYLMRREGFNYILSRSLLGVELSDVRSLPVGHLGVVEMFPLGFLKSYLGPRSGR